MGVRTHRNLMHHCAYYLPGGLSWNLCIFNWFSRRIHGIIFITVDTFSVLAERILTVSITQLRARFTTVRTNER